MDRRTSLLKILGKTNKVEKKSKQVQGKKSNVVTLAALDPYAGPFDEAAAAHLLRRVTFGPTLEQIKTAVSVGFDQTIQDTFKVPPLPNLPLEYAGVDPLTPQGETWVNSPYTETSGIRRTRRESVASWTLEQMLRKSISLQEKMLLFWHNHFVVSEIDDAKFLFNYNMTLRDHALGNFKALTKAMVTCPAMLRYLDGNQNFKDSPNENFARELLELFTVGKGPTAGPGDYTTFTEKDVEEMAKVLTGWTDEGWFDEDGVQPGFLFDLEQHDTSTKTLSERFGSVSIANQGDLEYDALIEIIFQKPEVADYICEKLYRYFIYYKIDDDIRLNVIGPMAQLLRQTDYEIQPVLELLFRSEYFYSQDMRGCMIKNPYDLMAGIYRQMDFQWAEDVEPRYKQLNEAYELGTGLDMKYYYAPEVAGWRPYYQAPLYHELWLNSVTLPARIFNIQDAIFKGYEFDDEIAIIDPLPILSQISVPQDVNVLIDEFSLFLVPKPLTTSQKALMKEALIPGLPDFEWEVEYFNYIINPANEEVAKALRNKLKSMLCVVMKLAEYQLI